jgi:chaperonin GroES
MKGQRKMPPPPRPSNVDRALVQAPEMESLSLEEDALREQEDTFLNVDVQEDEEGGVEVTFGDPEKEETLGEEPENFYDNLSERVSDATLNEISGYVIKSVEEDKSSRKDWEDTYIKGLDLLGLRYETRTEPFAGATGVIHPMINEAVTQFQSAAYKEMLPSSGPVRAQIVGTPTPDLERQAQRVQDYMNFQIMYEMEEYEPEFDQLLYFLGLAGSAFKKVYPDPTLMRPVSKFISSEDIVVPYTATDLRSAERVTHNIQISENELRKMQVNGVYRDIEIKMRAETGADEIEEKYDELEGKSRNDYEQEYTLYECHCYLAIDEYPDTDSEGESTDIKLPYVVTVCSDTKDVLAVRRNYREDDPNKGKIAHFVQYKFTPGMGFYGFGLVHLLGNLSRTATANLRQLIDAGTLANMPAGFKARGLRIADDSNPLQPGEFRDVDVPGGELRNSLMPLPYKEPSATLMQLMGFVVESAQRFVGTTDIGIGDSNQEMPVGTTIALLERGSRIISAVHKRLHASMKLELKMLAQLFSEDPAPYPYEVGEEQQIKAQDFDERVDILPVSDPNIFSMAQRVVLAQEQLKLAQAAPDMHNLYEAYRRVYQALGISDIDQILKPADPVMPMDPAAENQKASQAAAGQGKLQAFPEQDHDSHILVHLGYMQSKVSQMQPPVLLTLEKHIYEHLGLKAEVMAQQQPTQQEAQNPEQAAAKVAQIQAQLIQEYLKQVPPQPNQDPLVEIKKQELELKGQDQMMDAQHDQARLALDQQRLNEQSTIQRERIQSTEDIANVRAQIALQKQNGNAQ